MRVAVVGAAGGTGKHVVAQALAAGHEVIAVARRPEAIAIRHEKLRVVKGDVLDAPSIAAALAGVDAVVSTFGPADNARPGTLMSEGVASIIAACRQNGVPRFVFESGLMCSTGKGLGPISRVGIALAGWWYAAMRDDKRLAEDAIAGSAIPHWVIVRPPVLSDAPATGRYVEGIDARVNATRAMAHADVATFLLRAAFDDECARTIRAIGAA
jgi:uncharacterized protein YbjT (DUF2867 family)